MLNTLNKEEVKAAYLQCQEPRKLNMFNVILGETIPWVNLKPPIYAAAAASVELMNEPHHSTLRNLCKEEIDEGIFIYVNECGEEVEEPKPESFIRIKVGPATLDIREDAESKSYGGFFVDTPCDDFYFNLSGVSTTKRGPLHNIAHCYMNRGSSWAGKHRCEFMGYCFYLAYQMSHELKKARKNGGNNHA